MTHKTFTPDEVKAKAKSLLDGMGTDGAIAHCRTYAQAFPKDMEWWDAVQEEVELADYQDDPEHRYE
jgi:hypothetical protein